MGLTLVIGGTRSGKSAHAERARDRDRAARSATSRPPTASDPSMARADRRPRRAPARDVDDRRGRRRRSPTRWRTPAISACCSTASGRGSPRALHGGASTRPSASRRRREQVLAEVEPRRGRGRARRGGDRRRRAGGRGRCSRPTPARAPGSTCSARRRSASPPPPTASCSSSPGGDAARRSRGRGARRIALARRAPAPTPAARRAAPPRRPRSSGPATPTTPSTSSPADRPPGCARRSTRALDEVADAYPREDEAIRALAALHDRAPEEIVPTNGAAEALWLLPPRCDRALAACVHPGFTETEAALHAHGVPVVRVLRDPERGLRARSRRGPATRPTSSSSATRPRRAARSIRRRRSSRCAAPAAPSSSTRRSWTSSPASRLARARAASTT